MMSDGMMGGGVWMFFNMIFSILVIVGIVWLAVWAIQRAGGKGEQGNESSLEILKKRYAQGEISKEEYEEKKRDLL